jgi:hypothetical protein
MCWGDAWPMNVFKHLFKPKSPNYRARLPVALSRTASGIALAIAIIIWWRSTGSGRVTRRIWTSGSDLPTGTSRRRLLGAPSGDTKQIKNSVSENRKIIYY